MVGCFVSRQTLRRTFPEPRPATPWTGGRSFSNVPVPFFVGAAARRILALRAGLAFLSGVLKELVGFRFRVGELLWQVALQCRRLQAVTPLQLGT